MKIIKAALAYFALVFVAGFLLGLIRVPFLVPQLGVRTAELIEMPVMFVVILWSARFLVRRFKLRRDRTSVVVGLLALALLVGAELLLAVVLADQSIAQYMASRDPVSGGVYLAMLGLFAVMPTLVSDRSDNVET